MSEFGKIIVSRFYVERFQYYTYQYQYSYICVGCKRTLIHPHLKRSDQHEIDIFSMIRDQIDYLSDKILVRMTFYANKIGVQRPSDKYMIYPFIIPRLISIRRRKRVILKKKK